MLVRSLNDEAAAQRDGRRRDVRPDRREPHQPARGRAVVRARTRRSTTRRSPPRCSGSGFPRTGSTALSFLLAQDPARRSLRVWEASRPVPAAGDRDRAHRPAHRHRPGGHRLHERDVPRVRRDAPDRRRRSPGVPRADGARLPVADLRGDGARSRATAPGCCSATWSRPTGTTGACCKLLQWRCPPDRWWLKTPAHMLSIDALDAVYPDARFVMTHRDVAKVLPSVCALYSTFIGVLSDRRDPRRHRRPQPPPPGAPPSSG